LPSQTEHRAAVPYLRLSEQFSIAVSSWHYRRCSSIILLSSSHSWPLCFSNACSLRRPRSSTQLNVGICRASNVVTEQYEGLWPSKRPLLDGRLRLARWCRRSSRKINATLDLRWLRDELAPYQSSIGRPSIDREPMIRMLVVGSPDFVIHIGTIFFRTKREHQSAASCARDQISPHAPARGRLLVHLALGRSCMRQLLV
jgi:hypothetical protein